MTDAINNTIKQLEKDAPDLATREAWKRKYFFEAGLYMPCGYEGCYEERGAGGVCDNHVGE